MGLDNSGATKVKLRVNNFHAIPGGSNTFLSRTQRSLCSHLVTVKGGGDGGRELPNFIDKEPEVKQLD